MPFTLSSPQFSIVDFAIDDDAPLPLACAFANEYDRCIQLSGTADINFQMILTFDTQEEKDAFLLAPVFVVGIKYTDDEFEIINPIDQEETEVEVHDIDETLKVLITVTGQVEYQDLEYNRCFVYAFQSDTADGIYFSRNCFQFLDNVDDSIFGCETTLIKYRNNENSLGFYYCYSDHAEQYFNVMRLPFMLTRPQLAEVKRVFASASGSQKVVNSVIRKIFQLDTDYIPFAWHEALKIALSHDQVILFTNTNVAENLNPNQGFKVVPEDDYQIAWHDRVIQKNAPAQTRVSLTPYAAINPNCDFCAIPDCSIVAVDNIVDHEFNALGDFNFSSEAVIEINLNDYFSFDVIGCADEIIFEVDTESGFHPSVASVEITPEGIATVTMGVVDPDTYDVSQYIFGYKVVCTSNPLCFNGGSIMGTVSTDACPAPVNFSLPFHVPGLIIQVQWNGPTLFMPEPSDGYKVEIFLTASGPDTGFGLTEFFPATGSNVYGWTPADYDELDPGDYTIRVTSICEGELGSFDEIEFEFPDLTPGYTPLAGVKRGNDLGTVCGGAITSTIYIADPDEEIAIGAMLYLNTGLTIAVPNTYVVDPATGEIFELDGSGLVINTAGFC